MVRKIVQLRRANKIIRVRAQQPISADLSDFIHTLLGPTTLYSGNDRET